MTQLAIRCHPCSPVSTTELERWLERQAAQIREESPSGTVRVARLTQPLPSGQRRIGWLLELDLPDEAAPAFPTRLAEILGDMRLLDLQATVLVPDHASSHADPTRELVGANAP